MILPNRDRVKTVAAVHQQDGAIRVVVAALRGGGAAGSDVEIKAVETVHLSAGPAPFTALIDRLGGVDAVIRVLPAACTVARVVALPAPGEAGEAPRSPEAIADALTLMSESDLPAAIPLHRRSAGQINPGRGQGRKPVGLLTGWPETAEPAGGRPPRVAPEVCISEAAALAVLAQVIGGVEKAWTMDRTGGAMTILAAGPEKTIVRVARVADAQAAGRAIGETMRAAAIVADAEPNVSGWLALEPAPSSPRVAGAPRSADWLSQYGLAAAAIIAFADASPAVSSLVGLHEAEPKAKSPLLQRVSEWLGTPRRAAAIIVLCVLAAIALPIGASYAKLRLLQKQVSDEAALRRQNEEGEKELAFYRTLREKRWPMTKLLADIAGACPEGIHVDSVEIAQGEGLVLRGTADDTGKVTTFRENLGKTKVFTDVTTPSVSNVPDGVQFQLGAKVPANAATFAAKPIDDFAGKTLFERLYPEAAKPPRRATSTASRSSERTDRSSRNDRNARTDRRTSDASSSRSSRETSGRDSSSSSRDTRSTSAAPAAKQPVTIPPPLSDEAIARLSADDAMKEWAVRKKAAAQAGIDDAVKRRLMDESDKAKARMQAARGGGS